MKSVITAIVLLFAINCFSQTQEDTLKYSPRYGGLFNFNYLMQSPDFKTLPGIPTCNPGYKSGSATGFNIGVLYERFLNPDITLTGRLLYTSQSGTLSQDEPTTIVVNGVAKGTTFNHNLKFSLSGLNLQPMINYRLYENVFLSGGLSLGYVMSTHFDYKEQLNEGVFIENNRSVRNEVSGEIPDAQKIGLGALIGINAEFPMNAKKNLFLAPEFLFGYNFTNIAKDVSWNYSGIHAGLQVKYYPIIEKIIIKDEFEYKKYYDTVKTISEAIFDNAFAKGNETTKFDTTLTKYVRTITQSSFRTDTIIIAKPHILTAEVEIVGVDSNNVEYKSFAITNEEFLSSSIKPLLNYVFFDENASSLNKRYRTVKNTSDFSVNKLFNYNTLEAYYDLLNIVGKRLIEKPKAKLDIVGCNSNVRDEKDNLKLSEARANTVKDYLVNVWKVSPDRLNVKSRNLPDVPAGAKEEDAYAENRRAELYSDDPDILFPVILQDTMLVGTPLALKFYPKTKATKGLKEWTVSIYTDGRKIKDFKGTGDISQSPNWDFYKDKELLQQLGSNLEYSIQAIDEAGKSVVSPRQAVNYKKLTVKEKEENSMDDKKIDNYGLVLFEYGKKDLKKTNKEIVALVNKNIEDASTVTISGYADKIGDANFNKNLSADRAKSVKDAIAKGKKSSTGYGNSVLLYTNDLPEGRFYCRMVVINVETPIIKKKK